MNYFNYFTEIEEEFVKRRGSHMLVSPLDWLLMETWQQRGVPLHIVLRGINSSFDSYDQHPNRGRKVNSLFYCQQEVEANFLEYCESRVGGGSQPAEKDVAANGKDVSNGKKEGDSSFSQAAFIDYLSDHRETLQRLGDRYSSDVILSETFARASMRLEQIIDDLKTANTPSPESLEMDLTMIEEVILDGLKEHAGEEMIKQLEREGNQQLHAYRNSMERKVYQQTLDNFIARRLREEYRIPRLSLFYL
jgi:hypothetical protein